MAESTGKERPPEGAGAGGKAVAITSPGRPPIYTRELADCILARLAEGRSLRSVCSDAEMPSRPTVNSWVINNLDGFADRYARAREAGWHVMAEDNIDIADDCSNDWMAENDPENPGYKLNGEHVQRSRLRVDARKWLLSKMLPKVYGDKITQEHTGPGGGPLGLGQTLDLTQLSGPELKMLRKLLEQCAPATEAIEHVEGGEDGE